jgi:hypothetical protein
MTSNNLINALFKGVKIDCPPHPHSSGKMINGITRFQLIEKTQSTLGRRYGSNGYVHKEISRNDTTLII